MSKCVWERKAPDLCQCIYCGFQVPNENFVKECHADQTISLDGPRTPLRPIPPSLTKRAGNFIKASIKHVKAGMNHCSQEEKTERYNTCNSNQCGLYLQNPHNPSQGVCSHESCGCLIRAAGEFMDKLSWAESECPVGLWGKTEPKTP